MDLSAGKGDTIHGDDDLLQKLYIEQWHYKIIIKYVNLPNWRPRFPDDFPDDCDIPGSSKESPLLNFG